MKSYKLKVVRADGVPQFQKNGRLEIASGDGHIVLKTKDGKAFPIDDTRVLRLFRTASDCYRFNFNVLRLVLFFGFGALLIFLASLVSAVETRLWLPLILILGAVVLSIDRYVRVVIELEQGKILVLMPSKAFYDILDKGLLKAL